VRRGIVLIFLLLFCSAQAQSQPLSLEEVRQFRQRLELNWKRPKDSQVIEIRIRLKPDGTLASPPMVLTSGTGPLFTAARDAALRAVRRSAPFDIVQT
jgi:hypothetical protein